MSTRSLVKGLYLAIIFDAISAVLLSAAGAIGPEMAGRMLAVLVVGTLVAEICRLTI